MAVLHSTGNFAEELWPGIAEHWGNSYMEFEPLYKKFYMMETSDKAFEKEQQITGFPKAAIKEEGNEAFFTQMFQGFQKEYRHFTYSIGAQVTRELWEDEQYGQIKQIPRLLARSMRETEEVVAHATINNAFNSIFTGADGVELISNAHPQTGGVANQSNILATAADLSQTSLETLLTQVMGAQEDQGFQIRIESLKLIVPRQLYFIAHKLLETQLVVGSADNDKNIVANMNLLPIVTPYLTDPDAWYICTDIPNGLKFYTRRATELDKDNDFETDNLKLKTTQRFSVGFTDWRTLYGTAGAA